MQVIKVPGINGFGKTNGCRNAGNAILEELKSIQTNEKGKIIDSNLLDLEEIHVDNNNLAEQEKLIYENSLEAFESNEKVIFLGGDHSISYLIGKAFLDYLKSLKNQDKINSPCLIIFDAHADCMPSMKEPTNEEWLRALVEKENFPPENILLIGARKIERQELNFLSDKKIKRISINQIQENISEITDVITEFASGRKLYVSIDVDVLDPAYAKGTYYKEPGGLSTRELVYILSRISLITGNLTVPLKMVNMRKIKNRLRN